MLPIIFSCSIISKCSDHYISPPEFLDYAAGNLTATFDSPDQASVNVPISKVTFVNDTLYIAMDFAGLTFVGAIDYDRGSITWRS